MSGRHMARGAGWILAGLLALTMVAPSGARAEQDVAPQAVTPQPAEAGTSQTEGVKAEAGTSQTEDVKAVAGKGETSKGLGSTIADGAKATGRGVGRAGQVAGYGIKTAWDVSFDAVIDVTDATARFFKSAFQF
jgi:hypothetical protein